MASSSTLPVVDFSKFSIDLPDDVIDQNHVDRIAGEIFGALSTVGFVYLKNCGITDQRIAEVRECSGRFFALPGEVKKPYERQGDDNHGWVHLERESLNPERPGDLKEAYNVTPRFAKVWPNKEIPEFEQTMRSFCNKCMGLSLRVLKTIAIGLKLKADFFEESHNFLLGTTSLRCLYYPEIPDEVKVNQIRCGEHSDYGSITLLFQDDVGGLQVQNMAGEYVDATPIPDTVVVNIGDLMQRWTSDRLVSTKHRVIIPESKLKKRQVRHSLAFFVHPDDEYLVECLDGSNKYEPITGLDYLKLRFSVTY